MIDLNDDLYAPTYYLTASMVYMLSTLMLKQRILGKDNELLKSTEIGDSKFNKAANSCD